MSQGTHSRPGAGGPAAAGADTVAVNRGMRAFDDAESLWLFGYGSLLFKAGFPSLERRPATITGWSRRLWQGSHDHRGTLEAPGRVATLVQAPGAVCTGLAYRITPASLEALDVREKNGYLRFTEAVTFRDASRDRALVYIATERNAAFLGPAPIEAIARQVAAAAGPSGANRDYVLELARALRELGADDPHVFAVEAALRTGT